jgi:hypothetical protein
VGGGHQRSDLIAAVSADVAPGVFGGTECRRCDRDATIVLLQEEQARGLVFAPISPDYSTRSCSPHQPTTPLHRKPNSRGEGLLLLHHGHVLIAKERNTHV